MHRETEKARINRRTLFRLSVAGAGTAVFAGAAWDAALAASAQPGTSPYGPLGAADVNGVALPSGFTSRIVARSGQAVSGTSYLWHGAPDGGACFPRDGGGWVYVSNSELPVIGGASALRFDANGTIVSAGSILSFSNANCAGGPTPWGTWLSCEEIWLGRVFETFPQGGTSAVSRPAMGRFKHEAAACDPVRKVVYLTEDETDGCFYRFRPTTWGDLSSGTLEVLTATTGATGPVGWARVPTPAGLLQATRNQVSAAAHFNGGEGCWYANDICYFTTKGDNRVWAYNASAQSLSIVYDAAQAGANPPLTGVDNITGSRAGDLFVAEDGGNMEINIITPDGIVAPLLRVDGHSGSEITGPAFTPAGDRLYFSSQRGTTNSSTAGITFEVTGPFRV
ncbi:Secreted phosphatase, PhoX family [Parafrankia irregularis]|uniref:Secreted phosphatase, PhoX family n=1 Tax=Parafrankia irregularis TaxID=795642 RepID=A0A0S4QFY4_9ACTN|nr:Secreted phosphatase, PhoX family [Parafrankia irregularis]